MTSSEDLSSIDTLERKDSAQNRPSRDYSPSMDVYSMTSTKNSKKKKGRKTKRGSMGSRKTTHTKTRVRRKLKKVIETTRVYSFGLPKGLSDERCCCFFSRHFLIIFGLLAICVFSVILGLHFVKEDRFKERIKFASQTPDPHLWNVSMAMCVLLIFAHALLIVGAVQESPFLIWLYVAINTTLTIIFLIIVSVMMTMLMGAINSDGIRSSCKTEYGGLPDRKKKTPKSPFQRCKENKVLLPVFALLGGAFIIPALVLYMVLTLTAVSYAHSLTKVYAHLLPQEYPQSFPPENVQTLPQE